MHTRSEWLASLAGSATAQNAPLTVAESRQSEPAGWTTTAGKQPFSGIRVLDLTRVIAGPVCTKFLAAYGWDGPWRNRRGFDSLVQMSCGIADEGVARAGRDEPTPLPVQALDHAAGWLLATAITRALTRQLTASARSHAALIGTANLLYTLNRPIEYPPGPRPATSPWRTPPPPGDRRSAYRCPDI